MGRQSMLSRKRPASDMVSDFRNGNEQLANQTSAMTLNTNPVSIVAKVINSFVAYNCSEDSWKRISERLS